MSFLSQQIRPLQCYDSINSCSANLDVSPFLAASKLGLGMTMDLTRNDHGLEDSGLGLGLGCPRTTHK